MTNQMLGCVILGSLMLGVEKGGIGRGRDCFSRKGRKERKGNGEGSGNWEGIPRAKRMP